MKNIKLILAVGVLLIFHAVGLYGMAFSSNPAWYQALSPLNLLLTTALLFAFHQSWHTSFLLCAAVVLLTGFFSEIIGVHTGLLFGDYRYGETLGFKLWEVPVLIAVNWLLLVYITGIMVQKLPVHWLIKALVAAGLMVFLDVFIEPVAHVLDFWTWKDYHIPATNYWGWFGVGFLLQLYFQKTHFRKENKMAYFVYGVQLLFFIALNLLL